MFSSNWHRNEVEAEDSGIYVILDIADFGVFVTILMWLEHTKAYGGFVKNK